MDDEWDKIEIDEGWAGLPGKKENPVPKALKENAPIIKFCVVIFLFGCVLGFASYWESRELINPTIDALGEFVQVEGSDFALALKIFLNNARVSLYLIALGLTLVIPALILFANGFIIGFLARDFAVNQRSLLYLIAGIAPHGVFELPALFIAAALGMRIGLSFFFPRENRVQETAYAIRAAGATYLLVVLPLLFIASFIEAYASKALLAFLTSFI